LLDFASVVVHKSDCYFLKEEIMLKRKTNILFAVTILAFAIQACNASTPIPESTVAPTQTLVATQILEPVSTQTPANLPESEAEVPRVSVEEAKAGFGSGAAIIVDVRSAGAYAASHVPGAINIQLGEFETNPTGLKLDKDQWIITYCT
jgi:hypothetical protein